MMRQMGCVAFGLLLAAVAEAAEVLLPPGVTELDRTWDLTPADSGKVFRSADPARPAVISAARRISGFTVGADGVWRVTLPDVKAGKWNFTQLFVNGERRLRPALPAEGYLMTTGNAFTNAASYGGFTFKPGALTGGYANLTDIEVEIFYNWSVARMRPAAIDAKDGVLRFTNDRILSKLHSNHTKPRRFRIENVKEAFGRPGEWYLDRPSGELAYTPFPGEAPERCVVEAPRFEQIVRILGEKDNPVRDVRFENVVFRYANVVIPREGRYHVQGELNCPAAIELCGASNVTFRSCVLEAVGGYAAACGPETRDCAFESCVMTDLGAGGVKAGAPFLGYSTVKGEPENAHLLTSGVRVENCLITDGGEIAHAGIGVLLARTSGAKVLHNEIAHFDYTAISVGWDWNNRQVFARDNEVAFNRCYDIGRKVLSGMGIVYTLGRMPGTTIHDNVLHDIDVYEYGGKGIYLDECTSDISVYNNLVYDTLVSHSQSFTVGNRLFNNIFVDGRDEQLLWRTKVGKRDIALCSEHNIVVWRTGRLFTRASDFTAPHAAAKKDIEENPDPSTGSRCAGNLYWCTGSDSGKVFSSNAKAPPVTLAEWQAATSNDVGSAYAEPQFVDYENRDFRLKPTSPALKLGFKPFDFTRAGLSDPSKLPRAAGVDRLSLNGGWTFSLDGGPAKRVEVPYVGKSVLTATSEVLRYGAIEL